MRAALIDGKAIAAGMRATIAREAAVLADKGWQPRLVAISAGDTAAAELYVRNQQRSAESAGAAFEARNYPAIISMEQPVGVLQGLIDIGINRVDGRTVGDADFASCAEVAGWITPLSGGVGPVTVAVLMKNAVLATEMQMAHYHSADANTEV